MTGSRAIRLFAVLASSAAASLAGTMMPLDPREIGQQAPLVVVGVVESVRVQREENAFVEWRAVVRVESVLRGTYVSERLDLRLRRGLVFFDRKLARGDAGVFFLRAAEGGFFRSEHPAAIALFQPGTVIERATTSPSPANP